ncbi:MAG TPA: HD domain-containing protein [Deltaproteobacteria bacterium]|nr:HD domain-containing protein [Deltaproteobacteria bacterium]
MYVEVPLSIMRFNERYDFDLYMEIKGSYRLFAAKGALFTEQHGRLLNDGQTRLYTTRGESGIVEEYKSRYLSTILTDPGVDSSVKAEVAFTTSMASIKEVFRSNEPRYIADVENNAKDLVECILGEEKVMDNLIWINSYDHFTYQHSVRVGIYATALALKLFRDKQNEHDIVAMSAGFFLHDIGMAQVPIRILEKKTELTRQEWETVRMHPMWGYDRLLETGHLSPEAAAIVLSHHERHNGRGYPFCREGDGIPMYAKICAIADVFESLTAGRPYRAEISPFNALKVMQQEMSQDFDPELFRTFIRLLGG